MSAEHAPKVVSLRELVNPTPRQQEFLQAVNTHLFTLYGGAAGGGKSYILRWVLVGLLMKWAKQGLRGVRVGLFCEDYGALRDRHLSKIEYEFPAWLGRLKRHDNEYHLAPNYGGGVIAFRNLDEPSKYLSVEFAAAAVDELSRNNIEVFDVLNMRLRWPGIDRCPFIGATNPGGIGHAWVKRLWIDKDLPPELESQRHEFAYIPAKATDNPHLAQSYLKRLDSLPEQLRRAYRDGDWDMFSGQYFTEWRRDIHVCKPFEIPDWWRRFRSLDYGMDTTACYWWAVDGAGKLYIYRELYQPDLNLSQAAAKIIAMTPLHEKIAYTVASPDLWNRRQDTGKSGIEVMAAAGLHGLIKADSRRIQGWRLMREYLQPYRDEQDQLTAKVAIFDSCPNLIRTLPALVHSDTNPEDVSDKSEDHGPESMRYGLMSRPPLKSHDETELKIIRKRRQQVTTPVVSRITGY